MITNKFSRILIALDQTSTSDHALTYARSLAVDPHVAIALVTVVPPTVPASYGADPLLGQQPLIVTEVTEAQQEAAEEFLDRIAATFDEAGEVAKFLKIGSIRDSILSVAKEWNADLIIMGTNGRTGLDHFLSGSVAEGVVRRSKCPVLVIPLPDDLKED